MQSASSRNRSHANPPRVALVHDYLTQYGGAERVLAALHDCWPDAPIYTSIVDPAILPPELRALDIRQTLLARLPFAARFHRLLLPLYPLAFTGLRRSLRQFDVVISDSSAFAHHAPVTCGAIHICYCHSPARFLWHDDDYLRPARIPRIVRPLASAVFAGMRRLDVRAAKRVTYYIANSATVAERLQRTYGITAPVVYPPVDTDRFAIDPATPVAADAPWVVVSRLVPHKRIDLAVDAFTQNGWNLIVVGDGRSGSDLQRRAGPTVRFTGYLDDAETASILQQSRGLILPGIEDFGITAVEAQAAGRPVVAFRSGGALESVIDGETGLFFDEPHPTGLAAGIVSANAIDWDAERCRANAERFSVARFQREIRSFVATKMIMS